MAFNSWAHWWNPEREIARMLTIQARISKRESRALEREITKCERDIVSETRKLKAQVARGEKVQIVRLGANRVARLQARRVALHTTRARLTEFAEMMRDAQRNSVQEQSLRALTHVLYLTNRRTPITSVAKMLQSLEREGFVMEEKERMMLDVLADADQEGETEDATDAILAEINDTLRLAMPAAPHEALARQAASVGVPAARAAARDAP